MKTLTRLLLAGFCALGLGACSDSSAPKESAKDGATIEFQGVTYDHRWAGGTQHEFTPKGQEDLQHWTDMVTVLYNTGVKDEQRLAELANTILDLDKQNQATIVKTGSIPKTAEKPAEHLIIAVFHQPDFAELVFTRILMRDGEGLTVIYAHRIYGKEIDEEVKAWGKANGVAIEKALMALEDIPQAKDLPKK